MRQPRSLRSDDSGTIIVIAIFMSAALVGCIWYMFGLGEAMVYRQQLRAAADATAFASAVIDATGMNIISMINIAMAVALSVLLALQIVFLIGIVLTVISALLEIPTLGAVTPVTLGLVDFDVQMFNIINKVQEPVFMTIAALNVTAGVEGMLVPWVSMNQARKVPLLYKSAREPAGFFQPFSLSLIPTRVPFLFNWGESKLGDALKANVPILQKLSDKGISINPAKVDAGITKYGLPVTDEKYPVLCEHAAHQLVQEFQYLSPLGAISQAMHADGLLDGFTYFFGLFVGQFPGVFCSGVDPLLAFKNQLGVDIDRIDGVISGAKKIPILKAIVKPLEAFQGLAKKANEVTSKSSNGQFWRFSMYPMKPAELYSNGNSFGQVWATIGGDNAPTLGAITGVDVATWGRRGATTKTEANETMDYAEAEFYYDCGVGAAQASVGRSDSSGAWVDCKYNAMWNMFWKARVTRWQPVEIPVLKAILLGIYSGGGVEATVQWFASKFPFSDGAGIIVKYGLVDTVKNCFTNLGQGSSGTGGYKPGSCPFSTGGSKGNGTWTVDGTAPDGNPIDKVYH
jgi:hypothetical protein